MLETTFKVFRLKISFNLPKQGKTHEIIRPKISNYPKQDPFQAISLANGLRLRFSENNI